MHKNKSFISFAAAVQLAAPHTWPAAILPVILGTAVACAGGAKLNILSFAAVFIVAVLLQSAVNTLNDYADFVSGLDSAENCPDTSDAALIYQGVSPKAALVLGLLFLLGSAAFGAALVAVCGFALVIYAAVGLAAILIYTLPWISFSRVPLGELLSGGSMGGVLTAAAFHVQAGQFSWEIVWFCLPMVIMIGCIMLVNNTCDIEKDIAGERRTLAVCAGRAAAQRILRGAIIAAALLTAAFVVVSYPGGIPVLPFMAAAIIIDPLCTRLFTGELTQSRRVESMRGILKTHMRINLSYIAAIIAHILINK